MVVIFQIFLEAAKVRPTYIVFKDFVFKIAKDNF